MWLLCDPARPATQLFDTTYFVLVPVVMLSIVSGIIIDSFGSSRDKRNEVNEDQRNKCFICRCGCGSRSTARCGSRVVHPA